MSMHSVWQACVCMRHCSAHSSIHVGMCNETVYPWQANLVRKAENQEGCPMVETDGCSIFKSGIWLLSLLSSCLALPVYATWFCFCTSDVVDFAKACWESQAWLTSKTEFASMHPWQWLPSWTVSAAVSMQSQQTCWGLGPLVVKY